MLFADGRFGRGFDSRRLHHLLLCVFADSKAWKSEDLYRLKLPPPGVYVKPPPESGF